MFIKILLVALGICGAIYSTFVMRDYIKKESTDFIPAAIFIIGLWVSVFCIVFGLIL